MNASTVGLFITTLSILFVDDGSRGIISLESSKGPREAVVVFYNVENLFDTINDPLKQDDEFTPSGKYAWSGERYKHKLSQLSKVIANSGDELPLLVGLAEVENRAVLEDLIAQPELKSGQYEIIHFESLDERGIDVALMYRSKLFKPEHIETLFVQLGVGKRPTRDILYVSGKLKSGPLLHVFVNHWPSRYGGQEQSEPNRIAASRVLRTAVDAVVSNDSNASILIMGDFNDYPDNLSLYQELSAKGQEDSGLLVNLMHGKEELLRGSYNYRGEWGFLDQIIVSRAMYEGGAIMTKPESAEPYFIDGMLYTDPKYGDIKPARSFAGSDYLGGFSDHLPIRVAIWY